MPTSSYCSIPGCGRETVGRGWCKRHYLRWHKYGDPEFLVHPHNEPPSRPVPERLMENIVWNGDEDECWTWESTRNEAGYGVLNVANRVYRAHRLVYEWLVGPIPEGLHIDHLCRNRLCVNPEHLEAVTQTENNRRAIPFRKKKTHCKYGHPFDEKNTYVNPQGKRSCRRCAADKSSRWRKRNPEYHAAYQRRWRAERKNAG